MSAPVPAGVPGHDEIATLAGAIREGDLTPQQADRLAQLVEAVGASVRVARARPADVLWLARMWRPVGQYLDAVLGASR